MENGNQARSDEPTQSDSSLNKQCETHKVLSVTTRRTMFVLLAYSVFCAVIIAQTDVPFVLTSSGVQIPVINVSVNLKAFLLVGPLGLIAITTYLHLFLAKLDRITGLDEHDKHPFIFNFQDRFSRFLRFLVFYATPPIVMVGFSWKSAVTEWRMLMYFATMLVTVVMFLLYSKSRHRPLSSKQPTGYKAKPQSTICVIISRYINVIIGIVAVAGMACLSLLYGGQIFD